MNQDKYIQIKSVLNLVPESVVEEIGELNALQYAFTALRVNFPGKDFKETKLGVSKIFNHKAALPEGVLKLRSVFYTDYDLDLGEANPAPDIFLSAIIEDDAVDNSKRSGFLTETSIYVDKAIASVGQPLVYMGQDEYAVNNSYLDSYDRNCLHAFTVDRNLSCITTDLEDGYVIFTYQTYVQDTNGDFLIPDDESLKIALATYIIAMAMNERVMRGEANYETIYQNRLMQAQTYFNSANGKRLLRAISYSDNANFIMNRFDMQKHPYITGQDKNYRHQA